MTIIIIIPTFVSSYRHQDVDVDSSEWLRRFNFGILQPFDVSIQTRVWKSNFIILDWFGNAAQYFTRKLWGSFWSSSHQMDRGTLPNIPVSRSAIFPLTTCWPSEDILEILEPMRWRTVMVSNFRRMTPITMGVPAALAQFTTVADSGSNVVLVLS